MSGTCGPIVCHHQGGLPIAEYTGQGAVRNLADKIFTSGTDEVGVITGMLTEGGTQPLPARTDWAPAGPPKVCSEIRNHVLTAWPKGTRSRAGWGFGAHRIRSPVRAPGTAQSVTTVGWAVTSSR